MCAEATASVAASTSRSPTLLSQRSPNCVQPIPTIATRSRIPLLAMISSFEGQGPATEDPDTPLKSRAPGRSSARPLRCRSGLPEIVVHAVGGVELAERHLDPIADLDGLRIDVGHLALEA